MAGTYVIRSGVGGLSFAVVSASDMVASSKYATPRVVCSDNRIAWRESATGAPLRLLPVASAYVGAAATTDSAETHDPCLDTRDVRCEGCGAYVREVGRAQLCFGCMDRALPPKKVVGRLIQANLPVIVPHLVPPASLPSQLYPPMSDPPRAALYYHPHTASLTVPEHNTKLAETPPPAAGAATRTTKAEKEKTDTPRRQPIASTTARAAKTNKAKKAKRIMPEIHWPSSSAPPNKSREARDFLKSVSSIKPYKPYAKTVKPPVPVTLSRLPPHPQSYLTPVYVGLYETPLSNTPGKPSSAKPTDTTPANADPAPVVSVEQAAPCAEQPLPEVASFAVDAAFATLEGCRYLLTPPISPCKPATSETSMDSFLGALPGSPCGYFYEEEIEGVY